MSRFKRALSWWLPPHDARGSINRMSVLLFVLFGIAYALFTQDNLSHNTLCRAAMSANMVQYGRVDIDGYEGLTLDRADFQGRFYCDKAPGMSLMAAPLAFVFTRAFEVTPEALYTPVWTAFLYLCALTTSGLLTAAAGVLLFRHVLARTNNINAALLASLAFAFCGPVWGWATSFFSHSATAALLVMGYLAFDEACLRRETQARFAILAGLAFGGATSTEYTAVIVCLIIGAALGMPLFRARFFDLAQIYAWTAVAAVAALIPTLVFHALAFGSPLETGYAHTSVFNLHDTGLVGVNAPKADIIARLLFSADRGVIWYAPIFVAGLWAAVRALSFQDTRPIAAATLLVAAFYLLMNSGFAYWHGGDSTGPRYLTPGVGFVAIVLGLTWPRFKRPEQAGAIILVCLGILIGFACTAVGMTAGGLTDEIIPAFFRGELRSTLTYMLMERASPAHFVLPLGAAAAIGWLIIDERRRFANAA